MKKYLPYIIAGPFGLILLKAFTHTDMYKDYFHKARTTESVQLTTSLEDGQLNLVINNGSSSAIKNLLIDCNFLSETTVSLKKDKYTLYRVFNSKSIHDFNKFEVDDIPSQAKKVDCSLSDFDILSKKEVQELEFRKQALEHGYTDEEVWEYLKSKK